MTNRSPNHPDSAPRWLLARGLRDTARRFGGDWTATSREARVRLLSTFAWGLVGASALMVLLCVAGRKLDDAGRLAWETPVLHAVARGPLSFDAALWAESPGNSVFMIPVVLAAALLCVWMRRPLRAVAVLGSFFMLDLVVLVGWLAWDRARPTEIAGGIAAPGFHSFPSGHVAQMAAAYGFFVWLWMRGSRSAAEKVFAVAILIAATALVALARLRLGSHWPTDLIGAAVVGLAWLAITIVALKRAEAAGGR
ncbi:MAG TPA: phosphatase PAP2 family protein [Longimicrobium sp.]|nr:phosphatase PAP2 family protein [Longimicrobium sp.]